MNARRVEEIANAVLYEGYILYPYRPSSLKNRQRFNFGVLYPRDYCASQTGAEAWRVRTECLLLGDAQTCLDVKIRFLQLFEIEGWQVGREREVRVPPCGPASLVDRRLRCPFAYEAQIEGEVELQTIPAGDGLFKMSVDVRNTAAPAEGGPRERDAALLRSMVSVHSILQVQRGSFLSLLDPPEEFREAAAACHNLGTWPVLAGEDGQHDLMLSAPIILYDYPQIAPESTGDLCDGTEIDEILALRILTLTDAEKAEVRQGDDHARRLLERTESLSPEQFQKLHGALRSRRGLSGEAS